MLTFASFTCPFWLRNGHISTLFFLCQQIFFLLFGRRIKGKKVYTMLDDGSTAIFEVFENQPVIIERTIIIRPGFANTASTPYIQNLIQFFTSNTVRVVVCDPIGASPFETLTGNRLFHYAYSDELEMCTKYVLEQYPTNKVYILGISLGSNHVIHLLAKNPGQLQSQLTGVISVGNGYSGKDGPRLSRQWKNGTRCYVILLTKILQCMLLIHKKQLLPKWLCKKYGISAWKALTAWDWVDFDKEYTTKLNGYEGNVEKMFEDYSCARCMDEITDVPIAFINCLNDPIVPDPTLYEYPRKFCEKHTNGSFLLLKHGGHLALFDGGFLLPNLTGPSWLARCCLKLIYQM